MTAAVKAAALIVAAGRGLRAGGEVPKQYQLIGGMSVLERAIRALRQARNLAHAVVVIHPEDREHYEAIAARICEASPDFLLPPALGGPTRQVSVRAGLEALAKAPPEIVLIHDAARPFLSEALVARAIEAAREHGAAVPGVPVNDTIRRLSSGRPYGETLPRDSLRAIQTPQAFTFAKIRDAHARAAAAGLDAFTDDGGLAEWAGLEVHVFEGEAENAKLSLPADFARAAQHVRAQTETRAGLGGVEIAHTQGVVAHSDGDVLLHALTDALLGALGDGDIGMHFPPSDPRWCNAASGLFFEDAVARARKRGGRILHLDATVICEAPRIGAHRDAIRASIATLACIDKGRVSVKATTSEKLGFTGRGEGIAAQAIATLELPLIEEG
jgi:2-C-methyl-D-erythritol 4-phosphate cytidylyltransferase/2-C-methyl-D-erythritol 2,4-cyclodiphosphate synthase